MPTYRPHAHDLIAFAIRWADEQRLPLIASASPGVICESAHAPVWKWDRQHAKEGVSPIGAAILRAQASRPLAMSDLGAACVHATESTREWVVAFEVGLVGSVAPRSWADRPNHELRAQAHAFGLQVAELLKTVLCSKHLVRYKKGGACIACTPIDDPTQETPFPFDVTTDAGAAGPLPRRIIEDDIKTPFGPGTGRR